jgi:hypothetical protein
MLERAHGVEGVRGVPRAPLDGLHGLLVGRVAVPDGDNHTLLRQKLHHLSRAFQLRRKRHDAQLIN